MAGEPFAPPASPDAGDGRGFAAEVPILAGKPHPQQEQPRRRVKTIQRVQLQVLVSQEASTFPSSRDFPCPGAQQIPAPCSLLGRGASPDCGCAPCLAALPERAFLSHPGQDSPARPSLPLSCSQRCHGEEQREHGMQGAWSIPWSIPWTSHGASHGAHHGASHGAPHAESHGESHGASHGASIRASHGASHKPSHRKSHERPMGHLMEDPIDHPIDNPMDIPWTIPWSIP